MGKSGVAGLGALDESQRLEEHPILRKGEARFHPQPGESEPARQHLRLGHQRTADSTTTLRGIDRQAAGNGKIGPLLDSDTANDPALATGDHDPIRLHGRPDRIRAFPERTGLWLDSAAILCEGSADQCGDRLRLLHPRWTKRYGVALRRWFPHLGSFPIRG